MGGKSRLYNEIADEKSPILLTQRGVLANTHVAHALRKEKSVELVGAARIVQREHAERRFVATAVIRALLDACYTGFRENLVGIGTLLPVISQILDAQSFGRAVRRPGAKMVGKNRGLRGNTPGTEAEEQQQHDNLLTHVSYPLDADRLLLVPGLFNCGDRRRTGGSRHAVYGYAVHALEVRNDSSVDALGYALTVLGLL